MNLTTRPIGGDTTLLEEFALATCFNFEKSTFLIKVASLTAFSYTCLRIVTAILLSQNEQRILVDTLIVWNPFCVLSIPSANIIWYAWELIDFGRTIVYLLFDDFFIKVWNTFVNWIIWHQLIYRHITRRSRIDSIYTTSCPQWARLSWLINKYLTLVFLLMAFICTLS